jgi:hypothetical protein
MKKETNLEAEIRIARENYTTASESGNWQAWEDANEALAAIYVRENMMADYIELSPWLMSGITPGDLDKLTGVKGFAEKLTANSKRPDLNGTEILVKTYEENGIDTAKKLDDAITAFNAIHDAEFPFLAELDKEVQIERQMREN